MTQTVTTRNSRALRERVAESKAPAIARAAAVIRLLGNSEKPLALNAIARELELVPSTCLYVLRALVKEEFVAFDADTKRYTLGAGVLTLARYWLRRDPFQDLAQPALDAISQQFDATTLGVQITGLEHIFVITVSQGSGDFRLSTRVGSRFPALISATGRCIAAFGGYSDADLKSRFERLRWDNPPSFSQWQKQVAQTRTRGYAVDEEHYISGVTVVAAPVWKAEGALSHALVATGLSRSLDQTTLPALAKSLTKHAAGISRHLRGPD